MNNVTIYQDDDHDHLLFIFPSHYIIMGTFAVRPLSFPTIFLCMHVCSVYQSA